ncbi:hypothetical protein BHE74_00033811 [Ensete ventricosum]|nr:hypothetical protein GW17_00005364 [Ensete ventricosum]RWW59272.1 hypothetical protein BHE74_00033811 [Ensete ventricosum]RZS10451.1 hypothetical protein BHM03_00041678 [Ensete ventricosum]
MTRETPPDLTQWRWSATQDRGDTGKSQTSDEKWIACKRKERPGHDAIWLDPVLEAVELPASIAHLDAGLADMDAYDLPHLFCLSSLARSSPSRISPKDIHRKSGRLFIRWEQKKEERGET